MGLALDDEGIDCSADVVDRRIADQFERAGLAIDFDLADVRAVGKAELQDSFVATCLERSAQVLRHAFAACRRCRDLKKPDRAIGAFDRVAAGGKYDVSFGSFE